MKTNKNRKPNNSIKTLSGVLKCTSFNTFLIVGLNGCSTDSKCSDVRNLSTKKIEECKNTSTYIGSSSYSSGYFAPIGHNTSSSSRVGG